MKTKISGLIILLLVALSGSTCKKKITKFPFEMAGVWYSQDLFCDLVLVIEKNSTGKMFSPDASMCVTTSVNAKGKIKYKKDILYVDKKKFTIFNAPALVTGNDSIDAPDENDLTGSNYVRRKVLAKMTLQEKGVLTFQESYTFYKYVDY